MAKLTISIAGENKSFKEAIEETERDLKNAVESMMNSNKDLQKAEKELSGILSGQAKEVKSLEKEITELNDKRLKSSAISKEEIDLQKKQLKDLKKTKTALAENNKIESRTTREQIAQIKSKIAANKSLISTNKTVASTIKDLEEERKKATLTSQKEGIKAYKKEQEEIRKVILLRDKQKNSIKKVESQLKKETTAHIKNTASLKKENAVRNSSTNSMVRHIRQLETLVVAYLAIKTGYENTIGAGIQLNREYENAELGIAALIASKTQLIDVNGKEVTGMASLLAAQRETKEVLKEIKIAATDTPATFAQMTGFYQQAIGFATKSGKAFGKSIDEINSNVINFTKNLSALGSSVNMSMDLLDEEVRSLMSGDVSRDSKLALIMFGDPTTANAAIKEAKKQVGGLYNLFEKKLLPFELLNEISTFDKELNKLIATVQEIQKESTKPIFEDLKFEIKNLNELLTESKEDLIGYAKEIYEGTTKGFRFFSSNISDVADVVSKSIDSINNSIKDLDKDNDLEKFGEKLLQLQKEGLKQKFSAVKGAVKGAETFVLGLIRPFLDDTEDVDKKINENFGKIKDSISRSVGIIKEEVEKAKEIDFKEVFKEYSTVSGLNEDNFVPLTKALKEYYKTVRAEHKGNREALKEIDKLYESTVKKVSEERSEGSKRQLKEVKETNDLYKLELELKKEIAITEGRTGDIAKNKALEAKKDLEEVELSLKYAKEIEKDKKKILELEIRKVQLARAYNEALTKAQDPILGLYDILKDSREETEKILMNIGAIAPMSIGEGAKPSRIQREELTDFQEEFTEALSEGFQDFAKGGDLKSSIIKIGETISNQIGKTISSSISGDGGLGNAITGSIVGGVATGIISSGLNSIFGDSSFDAQREAEVRLEEIYDELKIQTEEIKSGFQSEGETFSGTIDFITKEINKTQKSISENERILKAIQEISDAESGNGGGDAQAGMGAAFGFSKDFSTKETAFGDVNVYGATFDGEKLGEDFAKGAGLSEGGGRIAGELSQETQEVIKEYGNKISLTLKNPLQEISINEKVLADLQEKLNKALEEGAKVTELNKEAVEDLFLSEDKLLKKNLELSGSTKELPSTFEDLREIIKDLIDSNGILTDSEVSLVKELKERIETNNDLINSEMTLNEAKKIVSKTLEQQINEQIKIHRAYEDTQNSIKDMIKEIYGIGTTIEEVTSSISAIDSPENANKSLTLISKYFNEQKNIAKESLDIEKEALNKRIDLLQLEENVLRTFADFAFNIRTSQLQTTQQTGALREKFETSLEETKKAIKEGNPDVKLLGDRVLDFGKSYLSSIEQTATTSEEVETAQKRTALLLESFTGTEEKATVADLKNQLIELNEEASEANKINKEAEDLLSQLGESVDRQQEATEVSIISIQDKIKEYLDIGSPLVEAIKSLTLELESGNLLNQVSSQNIIDTKYYEDAIAKLNDVENASKMQIPTISGGSSVSQPISTPPVLDITGSVSQPSQSIPSSMEGITISTTTGFTDLTSIYESVLGRGVDPSGAESWGNAISSGQMTLQEAASAISRSEEAQSMGVIPFAEGGYIQGGRGGVLGLIGEKSHDELVIPLKNDPMNMGEILKALNKLAGENEELKFIMLELINKIDEQSSSLRDIAATNASIAEEVSI